MGLENPPSPKMLPAFLQFSRADIHAKFIDLEWQQRHRLYQGMLEAATEDGNSSQWTRVSGEEVQRRNRYSNIDPFQNNRVKLRVPEGADDYINASPITLTSSRSGRLRRFIATQGPLDSSLPHLWRMVWHETGSEAVIVMLTQTIEAGREKCFQYFPLDMEDPVLSFIDEDADDFEGTVELQETTEDNFTRSEIRKLILTVGGETKIVWHYLFMGWPDFLIPESEDRAGLVELIKTSAVMARGTSGDEDENPRIVHCSAGVGRSGTFIALDYLLSELDSGMLDDVPPDQDVIADTVDELRKQRMMMVQGEQQFQFLYDVLKEKWLQRHGLGLDA